MKWLGVVSILLGVAFLYFFFQRLEHSGMKKDESLISYYGSLGFANLVRLFVGGLGFVIMGLYFLKE